VTNYVKKNAVNVVTFAGITAQGDFTLDSALTTCVGALSPRSRCAVALTFKPGAIGLRSGRLTINDNAANSPQIIILRGRGYAPTAASGSSGP